MLSVIQELEKRNGTGADLTALSYVLHDKNLQSLLKIYQRLHTLPPSSREHAIELRNIIPIITQGWEDNPPELDQLSSLLSSSPHLIALLLCYDQIVTKDYGPSFPEGDSNPSSSHEEETMKVVRLVKSSEPLGATIVQDERTGNFVFARILKGGPADRSGLIHVNDILVEVNNVPTKGKTPENIMAHVANFRGPLIFRLIPGEPSAASDPDEPTFVRAKFDFNPEDDRFFPCVEAGLRFRKNDILNIVSRQDPSWWQATLVHVGVHAVRSSSASEARNNPQMNYGKVGLIPSAELQKKREKAKARRQVARSATLDRRSSDDSSSTTSSISRKKGPWTLLRRTFRSPKPHPVTSLSRLSPEFQVHDDSQPQDRPSSFVSYEEVVLFPHNGKEHRYRPLVLIGAQGVGRNLLKEQLLSSDPTLYGVPVPHTSRPPLPDEVNGRDYHFVTRQFMEQGIKDNLFIEFGEYKGNLYGTSVVAVKTVMEDGQVCVLTPYPQALKMLCNKDIKPFVIFVKPTASAAIASTATDRQPYLANDLDPLIQRSESLEKEYGHLFDCTIIYEDESSALDGLLETSMMVANEPQWMPKAWVQ